MDKNIIVAIIGVVIAMCEIAIALYRYILEIERQKYIDTINIFESLLGETYILKEKYIEYFPNAQNVLDAENISSNAELLKCTMNLLTRWESFSRGLYYHVYDIKTFIYLTPKELAMLLMLLNDFVIKECSRKNYPRLFSDYRELTACINECVQLKIEGKKIPRKYIKKRSLT